MLINTQLSSKSNFWLGVLRIIYLALISILVLVCGMTLISIIVKIIIIKPSEQNDRIGE